MNDNKKKGLGISVKDSILEAVEDIKLGIKDVLEASEPINEYTNIKVLGKDGTYYRHTRVYLHNDGRTWVVRVDKKSLDDRHIDKISEACFSRDNQPIIVGKKFPKADINDITQNIIRTLTSIHFFYGEKGNIFPGLTEIIKGDNFLYSVEGTFRKGSKSEDTMLKEARCKLVNNGDVNKIKTVGILYNEDGYYRVKPIMNLNIPHDLGLHIFPNKLILRAFGIKGPAKGKY